MYAELLCKTNFSFLQGASHPEELIETASKLKLHALAINDRDGVYGIPKAFLATKNYPDVKLITGAELTLKAHPKITLLASDRKGYGLLCRMITAGHANAPKGEAALDWEEFLSLMDCSANTGLFALPEDNPNTPYEFYKELFGDRLYLPLARLLDGKDRARTTRIREISRRICAPIIATNDVHYHAPGRRMLQDVLSATRARTSLSLAGFKLFSNSQRHLKTPQEMIKLFADLPEAVTRTVELADRCTFSPSELKYRYPSEWIPKGETAQSYLEHLTWEGARGRYPQGIPSDVERQLKHEFQLIQELQFSDYFLTIWEIVDFSRKKRILCQGRGSAANSAVCYCLGITAVDPVKMNLLFERFISAERGEPPDIDVDFEHERREEVIQHIFERYGRDRAAMVSAVITYRSKSAIRDVSKALGLSESSPPGVKLAPLLTQLSEELMGFPRHLSIHSGGFVLSADPIIEVVPVEPARMEGRTIIQWDKYDLDALGLIKVDVLALGMLTALRKTMDEVGLELHRIPADDAPTYAMIQQADTVGVFQIESRAQMNMLGRLKPKNFYDLVVEVALVRPGPIVGKMVHPYLKRRKGIEPVNIPDPRLEPILRRTLGVPLFQEQVMKMAIILADFTPGEADQLRRAIGAWRSSGSIEAMGQKLRDNLLRNGLPLSFVDLIFEQIKGFAEYGFPESHAASFALLAYASSYLKCHHPAAFTCALINSQPMGFYSNYTLIEDARRHGVQVLPVDPNYSDWDCKTTADGAIQMGLRIVKGLSEANGREVIAERIRAPFKDLGDFLARTRLRRDLLQSLAIGDAFKAFGFDQRHALWEILGHEIVSMRGAGGQMSLFSGLAIRNLEKPELFDGLAPYSAIRADYSAYGLSTRGHPMQALREILVQMPKATSLNTRKQSHQSRVRCAGMVIVRQRPPTAQGTCFATLEDEFGFLDLILKSNVHATHNHLFDSNSFLIVEGQLQRDGNSVSVLVHGLQPLFDDAEKFRSRSYY